MKNNRGILIVLSGPSGSGKGTICEFLLKKRMDLCISISATTRVPRSNDAEGRTYFFKTEEQFKKMIESNELLEWVKYCDNYYGTPQLELEKKLEEGKSIVLEIDVTGGLNVKKNYPESILIFILPPKFEDLNKRLFDRGTEDETIIRKRIAKSIEEIDLANSYDYLVVNDTIENAVNKIDSIIEAEMIKITRNKEKISKFLETIKEVY